MRIPAKEKYQAEGYAAYQDGLHISECPYSRRNGVNTKKREAWLNGWIDALVAVKGEKE